MNILFKATQILYIALLVGLGLSIPLNEEVEAPKEEPKGEIIATTNLTVTEVEKNSTVEDTSNRPARSVGCCGVSKRSPPACCGANLDDKVSTGGCCGAEDRVACCGATPDENQGSDRTIRQADSVEKESTAGAENNDTSCCGAQRASRSPTNAESAEYLETAAIRLSRQLAENHNCCGIDDATAPPPPVAVVKREESCCGQPAEQTSETPVTPEPILKTRREAGCCGLIGEDAEKCCGAVPQPESPKTESSGRKKRCNHPTTELPSTPAQ